MIVYFAIFLIFSLFILIKLYSNDTQNDTIVSYKALNFSLIVVTFLLLFGVYYFRNLTVGTDFPMYNAFYYQSNEYLKSIGIEPGFLLLYSVARLIGNFRIVSLFSFFVLWLGIIQFAKQLKIDRLTTISFFVISYTYLISFNVIRQMTAIGIVLIGLGGFLNKIKYFKNKKISKLQFLISIFHYFIYVLIAQQFHASAWISLFIPLIMFFKVTPWKVLIGGIITISAYISGVVNLIFPHFLFLFSHYVEKYSQNGNAFFTEGEKSVTALLPIIIQFVFLYIIVTQGKRFVHENQALVGGYYLYLILFLGGGNTPMLRFQGYFLIFITFFYAKYFTYRMSETSFRNLNWFKLLVLGFWIVYAVLRVIRNISGVTPYIFQY